MHQYLRSKVFLVGFRKCVLIFCLIPDHHSSFYLFLPAIWASVAEADSKIYLLNFCLICLQVRILKSGTNKANMPSYTLKKVIYLFFYRTCCLPIMIKQAATGKDPYFNLTQDTWQPEILKNYLKRTKEFFISVSWSFSFTTLCNLILCC